jgi:hypothetical protein
MLMHRNKGQIAGEFFARLSSKACIERRVFLAFSWE